MRDQLIIRLTDQAPEQVSWVRLSDSNPNSTIEYGALDEAVKVMLGAQVVVLVPASDVLLSAANVPTQNKQRLLKAVPYAMEEELAGDVEELHFSVGDSEGEGMLAVAVVDRQLMDDWQEMLKSAGISADVVMSELSAVPVTEDAWTLLLDGNNALLRGSDYRGLVADVENLGVILPLVLKDQADELPATVNVWHDEDNRGVTPLIPEEIEVNHEQLDSGLLSLVGNKPLVLDKAINLLQGDYSRREQIGKLWRPWRYAAALAGVLFVLQLGLSVSESSKLEEEYNALKAEANQIYKNTFPNAKRIVNVKAQMQQELDKLKGSGPVKKVNFLNLLADSGTAFKQTSGLVLRSIRYKNGALDVELEVPNLQALDQLKQKISQKKGLSVEIQSAASRKNVVQGRLQIKGTAS